MASIVHLASRFLGSIRPGPPSIDDSAWAERHLLPGERDVWQTMSNPDRRHAVAVARDVSAELGDDCERWIVAAALLHDSGKVVSGYRTPARVVATLVWSVVDRRRAAEWEQRGRPLRRLAQYRRHPELGEAALRRVGADGRTADWAGDHHRPESAWRVPPEIGVVLKRCDGD